MKTDKKPELILPTSYFMGKPQNKTPKNTESIEAFTPESDVKVKGIFKNLESPGQSAKICCKFYKGMPPFNQVMMHDQEYTIPLSVAKFINTRIKYPINKYAISENGESRKDVGQWVQRYQFISTEYL